MMRRLGTTAALSLSVALIACGSDSTNPGPSPDARIFDSPPPTIDGGTGPDAGPGSDAGGADAGVSFSGTIALHSLQLLASTGDPTGDRFGQVNISFGQNATPLAHAHVDKPFNAPCNSNSFNVADIPDGIDGGSVTFTIALTGGGAGPVIPTCAFDSGTKTYKCGSDPIGDVIVDGDMVTVEYPGDGNHFAPYHNKPAIAAGGHLALDTASKTAIFAPDLTGGTDLTVTIDTANSNAVGLALVVVIDVSDGTAADPTDLVTGATKSANLTCAEALISNTKVLVPGALLKVLGDITPTKIRVSIFHDGSDLSLTTTNESIVVGQGFVAFPSL